MTVQSKAAESTPQSASVAGFTVIAAHDPHRALNELNALDEAKTGEVVVLLADEADRVHAAELAKAVIDGTVDASIAVRSPPKSFAPSQRVKHWLSRLAVWPLGDAADPLSGSLAARRSLLLPLRVAPESFDLGLELLAQRGEGLRIRNVPVRRTIAPPPMTPSDLRRYARRIMALAGGAVSLSGATRFATVGVLAMIVDLIFYQMFLRFGVRIGSAHIASFVISAAFNFYLNARWTFAVSAREAGEPLWRQYARFLAVAVMSLLLRGGVLGLASGPLGIPAEVAIFAGIAVAAASNFLGNAFFVFPAGRIPGRILVPTTTRWRVAAIGTLLFALSLRVVYMAQPNLLPEEAYYWLYAQHPDIGYLDHPPMVAWAIRAGVLLFGNSEFAVRLPAIACGLVALGFTFAYARAQAGKSAAFVTVLLLSALPYYFGASLVMSPDAPLTAAWAAAIYYLHRALVLDRSKAWWGVGISVGLGMLSKYTIALLGPAALVFIILDSRARRWLLRPEPYLALVLAALLFAPVIVWNAENDWVSFAFQSTRRAAAPFSFGLPELIGDILLLLTPIGAVAAVPAVLARFATGIERRGSLFVAALTLTPLAVFVAFSLTHGMKLNWTGPLWLAVLPAMAAAIVTPAAGNPWQAGLNRVWPPAVVALLLIYALGLHYLVLGLPGVPDRNDLRGLPLGWRDLTRQVLPLADEVARSDGKAPVFVGLDKYTFASEVAFYGARERGAMPDVASQGLFDGDGLMFARWTPQASLNGRTLILLAYHERDLEQGSVMQHCANLGPIASKQVLRDGRTVGRYAVRICRGYRAGGT